MCREMFSDTSPVCFLNSKLQPSVTDKKCFSPLHLLTTLDDDIFGTRAADHQLKMLNSCRADYRGQSADALADALFCIVGAIQFWRNGDAHTESLRIMLMTLISGNGEEAVKDCIVTAKRVYEKGKFMEIPSTVGLRLFFVMLDNLLRVHPFARLSFLSLSREENFEEAIDDKSGGKQDVDRVNYGPGSTLRGSSRSVSTTDDAISEVRAKNERHYAYDRREAVVIDDDPRLRLEAF